MNKITKVAVIIGHIVLTYVTDGLWLIVLAFIAWSKRQRTRKSDKEMPVTATETTK